MADIANVKIGAASLTFGGVDLGHTKGGCELSVETEKAEITVDETGSTIRDYSLIGEKATIKVPMAETQVANLAKAFPMGTLEESNTRLLLGKKAGERFAQYAEELVLRPNGVADDSEDVVLYKAVATGDNTIGFTNEDERIVEVEFVALWDDVKGALGHIGVAPA